MSDLVKPSVIIFSDHLLYPSETFIHEQARALCVFEPTFAGARRVAGLDLRDKPVHVINRGSMSGKARELGFKLFGLAPSLVSELNSLKPVLLHAHYGPNGLRALPLAGKLNVPIVVTFHGSDVTLTDLRYQKTHLGFRFYLAHKEKLRKSGALFLAVSRFIRNKLIEQGFPDDRIVVQYTGVDTKRLTPDSTESSPLLLFIGRLEQTKGAEFAIRAAGEVQQQMPEAELVLIGDGSLRTELEQLARQTLRRYRFLGYRPPDEVRAWLNSASVVCVPSVRRRSGEEEAFGMVCAEAQSVGKPVVAFHSGGIPEVVRHASTGYLVSERDWRGMAAYLAELLQDAEMRQRFGQAGRELILRQFDLYDCTRRLEQVYSSLIAASKN